MKNAVHQYEDKLLEFAYGELPQHEADAVDAHVRGCARCSQSLAEIRGVRATMAQLPMEAAPDAGLDSLLAYAAQAAKRNAESQVKPSLFKRFLMPLASVMALATVGVIAWRANQEFDTSPAAAAADAKAEEYERGRQEQQAQAKKDSSEPKQKEAEEQGDTYKAIAQAPKKNEAAPPPPLATAVTEKPTELAAAQPNDDQAAAGEGRGDANNKLVKAEALKRDAPQPTTRSSLSKTKATPASEPAKDALPQDWSNAAQRGGLRENWSDGAQGGARKAPSEQKKALEKAPVAANAPEPEAEAPAKPEPKPQDKTAIFGLGTGSTASGAGPGSGGLLGDLGTSDGKKQRAKKEGKEEAPAPVVVATPSTPAATAPAPAAPGAAPAPAPRKAPSKGSLSIGSMGRGSDYRSAADEDVSLETTDSVRLDNDAKYADRQRAAVVTRSLESARVASNQGDRLGEVKLLLDVLKNGPTGYQKVETLKRLCDALEALGEFDRADPYCDQLVSEFPGTAAAQAITQRRNATQRTPARPAPAAERSKKAVDELDSPKAEPAEQKQSAPAQAY